MRPGTADGKPKAVSQADMLSAMARVCGYAYPVAEVGSEGALNDALDGVRQRRWTVEPKVQEMVAQHVFGAGTLKAAPTRTAGDAVQKVELKLRTFASASYYWASKQEGVPPEVTDADVHRVMVFVKHGLSDETVSAACGKVAAFEQAVADATLDAGKRIGDVLVDVAGRAGGPLARGAVQYEAMGRAVLGKRARDTRDEARPAKRWQRVVGGNDDHPRRCYRYPNCEGLCVFSHKKAKQHMEEGGKPGPP